MLPRFHIRPEDHWALGLAVTNNSQALRCNKHVFVAGQVDLDARTRIRHPDKVQGLVLCATGHSFVKGGRERYVFTSTMAALAATTRMGQLAAHVPSRQVQRLMPIRQDRVRPNSLQRWAAAEMRRHDPRVLMEAGHAIGNYDAGPWIGEVDVPTTVLVTTEDRAIQPETQLNMARAIKRSEIHLTKHGHVLCARPEFASPLADACASVAERL